MTRLTRYEVIQLVAARAQHIAGGAHSTVAEEEGDTPLAIAMRELVRGRIPLIVQRTLADGTTQEIAVRDAELPQGVVTHLESL